MRINIEQVPAALLRGLRSIYLISGDEALLVDETADAVRAAARTAGYLDRKVFFVDRSFSWDGLHQESLSLSLFAQRRVIELRMPGGKPDKGAALLEELASRPPPDLLVLVISGKLDKKAGDSAWVRAVEKHGAWIPVWPVPSAALPDWLRAQAAKLEVQLDPAAAQFILARVEGNLMAAKQELEKLRLLAAGSVIDADMVLRSVGDSARYDVFQLAQAAAAGEAERAFRILLALKSEGAEPSLILWALLREIRGLWQARERDRLRSNARGSAWNLAASPTPQALARIRKIPLAQLLPQASRVDRVIKGLTAGDAWTALTALTGAFAGALQAGTESGRVAS